MKKHMLCLVILCCLLLQLLVFPAAASTTPQSLTQPEDLKQKITYFYHASLEYAEKSSFDGYCAFYVNTQLYLLKINRKYVAGNGNQQWENYRYLKETNGGYEVHAYSSRNYTLAESLRAISENGTKIVWNILICFQEGVGAAGRKYGHTCFIHAIIDGKVKSCYLAGTEIQFAWEDTARTVGYELILERQGPDGAYAVMDTVSTAISSIALSPEPGSYRAAVRSIHERGACCTSEPVYFRVVEQWDCALYGHELTEAATIAASCEEDGTITYTCAHCQDSPVITLPALGHSFGGGEVEQVPTEESEGQRVYTCATCGLQRYQTLPALSRNPFGDIRGDAYYYWPVIWAHEAGITMGMCEDEFEPYGSATRAQVVTFLWRMAGCPEPDASDCPFDDVDLESYYAQALLWALESGIARGMSDTKFAPGDPVTRGQFVTFLHRLAGAPEVACGTTFADTGFGAYYDAAVLWATRTGVTTGMGNGTFAPTAACTRGQIVTFLNRYAQPAD